MPSREGYDGFMSLRVRLLLVLAFCVVVSAAAGGLLVALNASHRVDNEIDNAAEATEALFRVSLAAHPDPASLAAELGALVDATAHMRHVRVSLLDASGQVERRAPPTGDGAPPVPAWFARLAGGDPVAIRLPATADGRTVATVLIETDPREELAEVWVDAQYNLLTIGLFCLGTGILVYIVTGQALSPLGRLAQAMRRVERGDYGQRLPVVSTPEVALLAGTFNHMAERLAEMTEDNRLLAERLVSLQEDERAEIARDLHDEVGPSLFAVNLDAAAIERAARGTGDREIAERARAILDVVSHIQAEVRALLGRLKPSGLDEFGLGVAIESLAQFWAPRHPEIDWQLDLPPDSDSFGRDVEVTAFRIVQESVTNALRHGRTRRISIALTVEPGPGAGMLAVAVADDGGGLDETARTGYGLAGMAERVRALGGSMDLANRAGEGLTVRALLPIRAPAPEEKESV